MRRLVACSCGWLLWAANASAEPAADAVLASLSAADTARAALAREQAEWDLDRGRQAALAAALRAEAARIAAAAARDEARAAVIAAGAATAEAEAERTELRQAAKTRAAAIEARLASLRGRWDPGPDVTNGIDGINGTDAIDAIDATTRLRTALARLAAAEQAAVEVEVSIETGRLGDETIAAQIVRLGLVAAWWRALDGAAAGLVEWRDGERVFVPVAPEQRDAIAEAIAIASRQRPPALVDLPLPVRAEAP